MTAALTWRTLSSEISSAGHLIALFDYDGTLAPFVKNPLNARLPGPALPLLQALARRHNITLGFVSGRSVADLQRRLPFRRAYFIGNHGFEIAGPGLNWVHPGARSLQKSFEKLARDLETLLSPFAGVMIEPKGLTISVHTRRSTPSTRLKCEKEFVKTVTPLERKGFVRITRGKQVIEACPALSWDKGRAVQWLIGKLAGELPSSARLLFVGDDLTDEDVFRLFRKALTVRVGAPHEATRARMIVPSVASALRILRRLKEMP